jgi:hypothetical protein
MVQKYTFIVTVVFMLQSLFSCGARSDGSGIFPDGGITDDSGVDSNFNNDSGIVEGCDYWDKDLLQDNINAVNRLGLGLSDSVVQGILSESIIQSGDIFVRFTIEKVWHGSSFLKDFSFWVPFDELELEDLTLPANVVIGFRGNTYPYEHDGLEDPVWWQKTAIVDVEKIDENSLGPMSFKTPFIVVAKLIEQNEDFSRFEVSETLKGEDVPETFIVTWSFSVWSVPFPEPGDTDYLISLTHLSQLSDSEDFHGTISDFRVHNETNREIIVSELESPRTYWDKSAVDSFKESYLLGWSCFLAPYIYTAEVNGIADECCTGAGGTFIRHSITEFIKGEGDSPQIVTGGHAYYGDESCGDQMIMVSHTLGDMSGFESDDFSCESSGMVYADAIVDGFHPERLKSFDFSTENISNVEKWISSHGPILRLFGEEDLISDNHLFLENTNSIWSTSQAAEYAILMATHIALIKIEEVVEHQDPQWYEVTISTTFNETAYDHEPLFRVKMGFKCGDKRFLEVGSEWLSFMIFDTGFSPFSDESIDYSNAFIIPGLLLPNRTYIKQIIHNLFYDQSMQ